ncbi:unnamed protein product [Peronospora farinosa]|uniref:Transmembrane protein 242 n=1 Tax=Peronospora farinosa TaxID=134698 RepID=A0AAV0T458_9STRA|nr:unnamed protein product [Peronospora farinosa]CAI5714374.1 unnamed protein product [Peronospora farinosa]
MSSIDDKEMAASEQQRVMRTVSTTVSVVAAVFLGGGFYYGMTKQKKAMEEEEKSLSKTLSSKKEFVPKNATFFERKLALDRALPPGTAASKALLGVTLVSVTSCCILVGGIAAALGVTNWMELRERLQTSRSQKKIMSKQLDLKGLGEAKKEMVDAIASEVKEEQAKSAIP